MNRRRCAIYTRKSTEEGLEQDFNSLDAQRVACVAYIKSQAGEGWRVSSARYDDGGLSGATLERPGLQALLGDIKAGKVNVVVVYKVDRLTRSLADFAKLVEHFDARDVSFVSVTQQFNTTSSMGRLTLNVLLSFAQFEREVTAERIRDKIAQSKKRGLWMGGVVPLGFDVENRKLILDEAETKTVRTLFQLYCELGSVTMVKEEADRLGLRTKTRKPNNGARLGGMPFTRGHIYKVLSNPIYAGSITHKGERYPGEHQAIIDQDIWERVQGQLQKNAVGRRHEGNTPTSSLLTGKLVDTNGVPLVPTYAKKGDRRYRYYISQAFKGKRADTSKGWRLPAESLEQCVIDALGDLLHDQLQLLGRLGLDTLSTSQAKEVVRVAAGLRKKLSDRDPARRQALVREIVEQVRLEDDRLRISISAINLCRLLNVALHRIVGRFDLEKSIQFKRRGIGTKLVLGDQASSGSIPNPALIKAISESHQWFEDLRRGRVQSIGHLAKQSGVHPVDVSRRITLAFLAPDIVEAIFDGRQPSELTAKTLKRFRAPPSWKEQRQLLGFTV